MKDYYFTFIFLIVVLVLCLFTYLIKQELHRSLPSLQLNMETKVLDYDLWQFYKRFA